MNLEMQMRLVAFAARVGVAYHGTSRQFGFCCDPPVDLGYWRGMHVHDLVFADAADRRNGVAAGVVIAAVGNNRFLGKTYRVVQSVSQIDAAVLIYCSVFIDTLHAICAGDGRLSIRVEDRCRSRFRFIGNTCARRVLVRHRYMFIDDDAVCIGHRRLGRFSEVAGLELLCECRTAERLIRFAGEHRFCARKKLFDDIIEAIACRVFDKTRCVVVLFVKIEEVAILRKGAACRIREIAIVIEYGARFVSRRHIPVERREGKFGLEVIVIAEYRFDEIMHRFAFADVVSCLNIRLFRRSIAHRRECTQIIIERSGVVADRRPCRNVDRFVIRGVPVLHRDIFADLRKHIAGRRYVDADHLRERIDLRGIPAVFLETVYVLVLPERVLDCFHI